MENNDEQEGNELDGHPYTYLPLPHAHKRVNIFCSFAT